MHFMGLITEVEGIMMRCCRLFVYEVHYYRLSMSSFDSCLFYNVCINNQW